MKMKPATLLVSGLTCLLLGSGATSAGSMPSKGYVQNDQGEKCWYTQTVDSKSNYFHSALTATVGTIRFDVATCMSDSGIGLETNKMMINNVISRWYSRSDAKFMTRASELFKGSTLQERGQCMQSRTYSAIGIVVDYQIKGDSIIGVKHGPSLQGCKN